MAQPFICSYAKRQRWNHFPPVLYDRRLPPNQRDDYRAAEGSVHQVRLLGCEKSNQVKQPGTKPGQIGHRLRRIACDSRLEGRARVHPKPLQLGRPSFTSPEFDYGDSRPNDTVGSRIIDQTPLRDRSKSTHLNFRTAWDKLESQKVSLRA